MKISDIFNAQGAVAYIEQREATNSIPYMGEAFFPVRRKMGIDLKWIKTRKGAGVSLAPSNFDALSTIRPRKGFEIAKSEMPFFRESMIVKEQDEMDIMRAQDLNDPYVDEVLSNIYDDVVELSDGARINMERMRMQLLSGNGGQPGISIGTADQTYLYDYDPNGTWLANNYVDISGTAANKWGTKTAKPITDINTGKQYLASIGYVARYVLMNSTTFNDLQQSDEIGNLYFTLTGMPQILVDGDVARTVIERKTGLTLIVYDKVYADATGATHKFYPDGYCSIVCDQQLGNLWTGTTPEERTLLGDSKVNVDVTGDGVAVAVQNLYGPPVQTKTTVSQICLPSFENMDGVYVIKTK